MPSCIKNKSPLHTFDSAQYDKEREKLWAGLEINK